MTFSAFSQVAIFHIFRFVPFKKKGKHYEPLLHTTSKYGHLPYGTKFYREEFPDKHVTQVGIYSIYCEGALKRLLLEANLVNTK